MPLGRFEVTLVDSYGHRWICVMNNDQQNPLLCGLEDGWSAFSNVKLLSEGRFVKLQFSASDSTVFMFERT